MSWKRNLIFVKYIQVAVGQTYKFFFFFKKVSREPCYSIEAPRRLRSINAFFYGY